MVAQMALFALCGLLTQPVLADSDHSQRLVVDGDTLTVQVLGEPRPANEPPEAVSDDSLLAQTTSPQTAVRDSAEHLVQAGRIDEMAPNKRVATKLASGTIVGVGGGLVGFAMGFALGSLEDCSDCDRDGHGGCDFCGWSAVAGGLIIGSCGYLAGTAIGVSQLDPHDLFIMSLIGSVAGFAGGIGLTEVEDMFWPSLFIGPVIGATLMSEWSRKPPQARRVSVGLAPDPRGRLSAVVSLRF